MKKLLSSALLSLLLGSAACGKKQEIDCAKVAAHVADMIRVELARESDPRRIEQGQANLPTLQSALASSCEESKWSEAVRRCVMDAKTAAQMSQCDPALPASGDGSDDAPAQGSP
jgi:hypothetical protein